MAEKFEMVAKTFQGLEGVLAKELIDLGAENVQEVRRGVSFYGDKKMLYMANFFCRTALRVLKPIYTFEAESADEVYEKASSMLKEQKEQGIYIQEEEPCFYLYELTMDGRLL